MTRLQIWLLRRVFRKAFIQSAIHRKNLVQVYGLIREALDKEFTEDNFPTLDAFCFEAFNESLVNHIKGIKHEGK